MIRRAIVAAWMVVVFLGGQASAQGYSYEQAIYDACARYGCNGDQLVRVMYCESGGNPYAVGPNGERGLFQYHPYGHNPAAAWVDPYTQIDIAAREWAAGLGYLWVCQGW
jgi:hypothetical protein